MLKEGGLSLVGYQAEKMISAFHVDLAVCSCKGLDGEKGITDSNEKDAEIKKAFFGAAKKKVLAVDHTKFDKISFVQIGDLQQADMIVTDQRPEESWLRRFENAGVEIRY